MKQSESSLERGSEEEDVTSPEQQEGEGGPLSSGEEPTVTEICVDPESSPRQLQDSGRSLVQSGSDFIRSGGRHRLVGGILELRVVSHRSIDT
uniref:Uncharacterized protein n=1 Tax=Timema shepardi TaxID=629360 RepID=A0A7R9G0U2_TIMSH|nr:unnamed protein product [Timema shepardi]